MTSLTKCDTMKTIITRKESRHEKTAESDPGDQAQSVCPKDVRQRKDGKIMEDEDMEKIQPSRNGTKKKIRTLLNRRLRHSMKNKDLPNGAAYRRESGWEEE